MFQVFYYDRAGQCIDCHPDFFETMVEAAHEAVTFQQYVPDATRHEVVEVDCPDWGNSHSQTEG